MSTLWKLTTRLLLLLTSTNKSVPAQPKDQSARKKSSFNTSRNKIMAKIRKNSARKKSQGKNKQFSVKDWIRSMIGITDQFKPQFAGKTKSGLNARRNSWKKQQMLFKIANAFEGSKHIKIKPLKAKKFSKSRSASSKRKTSRSKNRSKERSNNQRVKIIEAIKSPFALKLLNAKVKKSLRNSLKRSKDYSSGISCKTRRHSKEEKRSSPKKNNSWSFVSRNLAKIYWASQLTSPKWVAKRPESKNKSTPKEIGSRANSSYSHRNIYFTKKSQKSRKSSKKQRDALMSSQQSFLDFLLKSTNNPILFAKDFDNGHAKSQFTYQPTRSQVTTNAATLKGTISPQSTNFIGTTRVGNSNKKFVSDFKNTWEEACRVIARRQR